MCALQITNQTLNLISTLILTETLLINSKQTYPDKFIRDNVFESLVLLSIVIVTKYMTKLNYPWPLSVSEIHVKIIINAYYRYQNHSAKKRGLHAKQGIIYPFHGGVHPLKLF